MRRGIETTRWHVAQQKERNYREKRKYTPEGLENAKKHYIALIGMLPDEISFDQKRILEIGGAGTSIFLALSKGEKYMVDPLLEHIFNLNPFLTHVDEYKDVNRISKPFEDMASDKTFDVVFAVNVLDHMADLKAVADKMDQLLSPHGYLIITVDCYGSTTIRDINRFFDVDLAHPHHFSKHDVVAMLPRYRLIKYDDSDMLFEITRRSSGEENLRIHEPYRLFRRALRNIDLLGKRNAFYIAKFFVCYSICLLIALVRRTESPLLPLKKRRLFVFARQSATLPGGIY